jgi:hypothetical protein
MAVTADHRQCGKIVRASDGETILDSGPRSELDFGPITASSKPSMPRRFFDCVGVACAFPGASSSSAHLLHDGHIAVQVATLAQSDPWSINRR